MENNRKTWNAENRCDSDIGQQLLDYLYWAKMYTSDNFRLLGKQGRRFIYEF